MASEPALVGNTAKTSEPGAPSSGTLDMASEQRTVDSTVPTSQDGTFKQVPISTTVETHEPGEPTQDAEGKLRNPGPYDDDAFNARVKSTEAGVVGTFEKAFRYFERPASDGTAGTSVSTQGKGGVVLKNRWDDDDTIENQMRNTTAQVVGTFKGLSTALQQAGEKIRGGVKKDDSSTK